MLAPTDAAVADVLSDAVESATTAGVVAGIGVAGRAPVFHAFGTAALGGGEPVHAGSRFAIGSLTKQFTAACVLLLSDRGKLSLDDPLVAYVPKARRLAPITVRQLLHHTSGLPKIGIRTGGDPFTGISLRARVDAIDLAACLAPGARYRYSNLNYWLLGEVIEVASGAPYANVLHDGVLRPLGMNDSSCDARDRTVGGHTGVRGALRRTRDWHPDWLGSAASVVASAPDVLRWNFGARSLLSPYAFATMFAPDPATAPARYACGWIVGEENGAPFVWHNGEIGGFHAANVLLPRSAAAICVLSNTDGIEGETADPLFLAQQIADRIAPAPDVDAGPRVRRDALELAERRFDAARFSARLRGAADRDVLDALEAEAFGPVLELRPIGREDAEHGERYRFNVRYRAHRRTLALVLDREGRIDEFTFGFLNIEYGPGARRR